MPTIDRPGEFRVMVHTDDHEPAHVHFYKGTGYAKVDLGMESGMVRVIRTAGLSVRDVMRSVRITEENRDVYLWHWRRTHG